MMGCACTAREDNTRWDDQYMDGVRNMFSLLWLDTDGCHRDGLWTTSLVSTRSDCALSRSVMPRCAPFLRPDPNQRVGSLMFRRQRADRHKENLDWNNTSA